jgi:hypothetical protein
MSQSQTLATNRAKAMTEAELANQFSALSLAQSYGLTLPQADVVINAERLRRARG